MNILLSKRRIIKRTEVSGIFFTVDVLDISFNRSERDKFNAISALFLAGIRATV